MLLNLKHEEHVAYFHNNRFSRTEFCSSVFFNELLNSHTDFKNPRYKKPFHDVVNKVLKREMSLDKKWKRDVDVIYEVVKAKSFQHWIGLAINLKNMQIKCFTCKHPTKTKQRVLQIVTDIAGTFLPLYIKYIMF